MPQSNATNRRFVLAQRPKGEPDDDTLRLETTPIPEAGEGQLLLRNEYLSLDPYMRGRMSAAKSYAEPVKIDEPMIGGTISQVVTSHVAGFEEGDWVVAFGGWQDYAVCGPRGVINLGKTPEHPTWALGVLGMPGLTAYAGLTQIGQPKPGETLVVAAASGPVGATVGQIGRGNDASLVQQGRRNSTVVGQDGAYNYSNTYQTGTNNLTGVAQIGNYHSAITEQSGVNNGLGVIQVGEGQSANVKQSGRGNVTLIIQGDH